MSRVPILHARGDHTGETGGDVKIIGNNVGLIGNTAIDVSGNAGGGDMRIGFDNRDKNGPEAAVTFIGKDVTLNADAIHSGNGGFIETSAQQLDLHSQHISALGGE